MHRHAETPCLGGSRSVGEMRRGLEGERLMVTSRVPNRDLVPVVGRDKEAVGLIGKKNEGFKLS